MGFYAGPKAEYEKPCRQDPENGHYYNSVENQTNHSRTQTLIFINRKTVTNKNS